MVAEPQAVSISRIGAALLMALAWWYDEWYDGPETTFPEWVRAGEEALGRLFAPDGDARDRHEAVHAAIDRINFPKRTG